MILILTQVSYTPVDIKMPKSSHLWLLWGIQLQGDVREHNNPDLNCDGVATAARKQGKGSAKRDDSTMQQQGQRARGCNGKRDSITIDPRATTDNPL